MLQTAFLRSTRGTADIILLRLPDYVWTPLRLYPWWVSNNKVIEWQSNTNSRFKIQSSCPHSFYRCGIWNVEHSSGKSFGLPGSKKYEENYGELNENKPFNFVLFSSPKFILFIVVSFQYIFSLRWWLTTKRIENRMEIFHRTMFFYFLLWFVFLFVQPVQLYHSFTLQHFLSIIFLTIFNKFFRCFLLFNHGWGVVSVKLF